MLLKNKIALVTGSTQNIGLGIARAFAREGAKVVVHSRHPEDARKVAQELNGDFCSADVSDAEQGFSGVRFVNDLERPVFEKFVLLGYFKNWLRAQPEVGAALLSGSGSTLFAVLRDGADAKQLEERIRVEIDPKMWIQACETV